MSASDFNQGLIDFIAHSPTPFHAVSTMSEMLVDAGYVQLHEQDEWRLSTGKYFISRNDSSLIAFTLPDVNPVSGGLRMVGAHTDSPCLKIKPSPVTAKHGYYQVGVEVYGGVLMNPWFDRDLSIAGRLSFRNENGGLQSRLIDFREPVALIPSLAIHLDRTANEQRAVNAQTDLVPVLMLSQDQQEEFRDLLKSRLTSEHADINVAEVLDYELSFYDTQRPALTGLQGEFISGARLDNLVSCYAGIRAIMDCDANKPSLVVCYDHEEIGSGSASGAQGPFLQSVLERIVGSSEQLTRALDRSLLVSCDNAHGIHPNFPQKHDGNHAPVLNHGPVIKMNANQRYASNSETAAMFRSLCHKLDIPVQDFVMRADMACGSTIGPITASEIGIRTVDVGVPQWAMHSIRETCGSEDPGYLYQVAKAFFDTDW